MPPRPKKQKTEVALPEKIASFDGVTRASFRTAKQQAKEAAHKKEQDEKQRIAEGLPPPEITKFIVQFTSEDGEATGSQLELPADTTPRQLRELINQLLANEEPFPYSFLVNDQEIVGSVQAIVTEQGLSSEAVLNIVYQPQAIFRVRPVTRCSSTVPGHEEAILHCDFSADGKHLATGSGDATVRLWDLGTELPRHTLKGHASWVLAVAWSPLCHLLASGGMDNQVRLWDPVTGKSKGLLRGHKKWVTCLAWEPFIANQECKRLASGGKDGMTKIWDTTTRKCILSLGCHTAAVNQIKWGGAGLIYTASKDRTIKVWSADRGIMVRSLEGHAHWVNCISLSTEAALRQGPFDHLGRAPEDVKDRLAVAQAKYNKVLAVPTLSESKRDTKKRTATEASGDMKAVPLATPKAELLVSGSDDFTCYLWNPVHSKHPVLRLTGHQQPVNFVRYSPDGRYIASASFDGSVRLWHGTSGQFLCTFRGHVQAVYQVCWSLDSRYLVSSSKDSTIKLWEVRTRKMVSDLPGHSDEVYAVDWSPDGERVASGGKDCVLKIWRQ